MRGGNSVRAEKAAAPARSSRYAGSELESLCFLHRTNLALNAITWERQMRQQQQRRQQQQGQRQEQQRWRRRWGGERQRRR